MRRKNWLFITCCLLLVAGCQGCGSELAARDSIGETRDTSDEKRTGAFPQIMVGVWEAKVGENDWEAWAIKFETDGSIKKIYHPVAGQIRLEEGGVQKEGQDPNTYMVFQMGPCKADYVARNKILNVKVIVDYYRMVFPTGVLEGKMDDYFSGTVSADGKMWKVDWINYGYLEGAEPPDVNAIRANPVHLTFYKIDLNDPNKSNQ